MGKELNSVKLRIDGYNDRRTILSILAENGYKVMVEKEPVNYVMGRNNDEYYVIIEGIDNE